jgi:hypothetical protein
MRSHSSVTVRRGCSSGEGVTPPNESAGQSGRRLMSPDREFVPAT